MERISFLFVIILLQMFQSSLCVHANELKSLGFKRCKKHELDALLKFKQSFTKDPKKLLSSWFGEDCCQWHGVTCDDVTDNVVKLNLRSQPQPQHFIFDDIDCLPDPKVSMVSSGVSSALLELKLLTHLDLSGNNFSGGRIPEFIGSLRQLRYLNLSSVGFSGPIPPQLGNLTNLVHLDLHVQCYYIPQHIYPNGLGWASSLLKLQSLDMGGYNLSHAHDTFKVLNTLPSLSALSLSYCQLDNSHLSEAFITRNTSHSFFPTLQHLNLASNWFDGPFPPVLKNMVSLRSLSLHNNHFNGTIPLWLRTMRHLEVLDLSFNGFSYVEGGIMGIMGNPCNFKHLDLSNNIINQGDIIEPSMSLCACDAFDLEYLALSYSYVEGGYANPHPDDMNIHLPSSLGKLTNLNYLDLSTNEFKGQIPASFVNLSALKYLDLSYNQLGGLTPDLIGHLTEIEYIDISSNSLQGTVFGIGNLSKLSYLDMNYNNLNLILGSSFDWQPSFQLVVFNVHSCGLNTVFPQWLRNQTQIADLDLSNTSISGELPGWLWNSSYLQELQLSGNQLTGSLPQHKICDGCELLRLNLRDNLLTGAIPKWLFLLENIEVIVLSSNLLKIFERKNGSSLFNIGKSLVALDLSDNMLSGEIQFGKVPSDTELEILSLRGNQFNGPIPLQLCDFNWLSVLELSLNRFTGRIPPCLGSIQFDNPHRIGFYYRDMQIEEIVKGIVEFPTRTYWAQSLIDLSCNNLVGTIPEELTNISALFALNLSYNHLTGQIPENIGNLEALESLDLSNNHLVGIIPESLSSISSLSKLNLSNNNLHGPIPTGRQLQTLDDPSIYANNTGLCGFPLNNCTKFVATSSSTNVNPIAGKYDDKMWLILAVMSGVATGFWGVVGTLVIKRSWRQAYFRYVEDVGDKIYVPIKVRVNRFKRRLNEKS